MKTYIVMTEKLMQLAIFIICATQRDFKRSCSISLKAADLYLYLTRYSTLKKGLKLIVRLMYLLKGSKSLLLYLVSSVKLDLKPFYSYMKFFYNLPTFCFPFILGFFFTESVCLLYTNKVLMFSWRFLNAFVRADIMFKINIEHPLSASN